MVAKYRVSSGQEKNYDRLSKASVLIKQSGNIIQNVGVILTSDEILAWESTIDKYIIGLLRLKSDIATELRNNLISETSEDLTKDIEGDVF